jgi:nucleoside-diphosphate-sugar epimerase
MPRIENVEQLEDMLSEPPPHVIETMAKVSGDVIVLGIGGKMGPTLARMIRRATDAAGIQRRIVGVSRFTSPLLPESLRAHGIEPLAADLLDRNQLSRLPDAPNIIYMAGMKFGGTGNESLTWAMNGYLPGMVCERYRTSRIVAFSTGNVYGLVPATGAGSRETDSPNPLGDYAMSCLGRERIVEHFSRSLNIPTALIRLNYATEMRYGVLMDIARRVWLREPIDVSMGYVNVIWQGEANAMAISALRNVSSPPFILNVAGPEILSVREVAHRFAKIMNREPTFIGKESPDALLNNGSKAHGLFGTPIVDASQLITWAAEWVMRGGADLGKPTHFQTRDGKF